MSCLSERGGGGGYVKFGQSRVIYRRLLASSSLACEPRRISGCHFSPPKNNVCVPERQNDFRDVEILSQSPFNS